MRQTLIAILISFVFVPTFGQSGQRYDARAKAICDRQIMSGDRQACYYIIYGYRFDQKVLPVCQSHTFDSDKRDCLQIIRGRVFTDREFVEDCKDLRFDNEVNECLFHAPSKPL